MKTQIIEKKENPLFNRNEIILEIESEIVPSRSEVEKIISEKFSAQPETIKINKIASNFGSKIFKVTAHIYSSKKDKYSTEVNVKKERGAKIAPQK